MEEELELPLENGYTLFGEVHDSTTLEPTHEEFFSFLREVHVPTTMEPSNDENFALFGHLGELVLSPTSYTSKFCSIHPNELWVKGFFFIVTHEEYGIYISPFDDDIIREPYSLHLQQHPFLHYDDTHLHGCTYDVHLSHLKTHEFACSLLSPFNVGGTSSNTRMKMYMIEEHYYWQIHPLLFLDDIHIHGCIDETYLT